MVIFHSYVNVYQAGYITVRQRYEFATSTQDVPSRISCTRIDHSQIRNSRGFFWDFPEKQMDCPSFFELVLYV